MEEKLIKYLDEIVDVLKQGAELASEQAPIVIQEFLNWGIATGIMQIVLGVFFGCSYLLPC